MNAIDSPSAKTPHLVPLLSLLVLAFLTLVPATAMASSYGDTSPCLSLEQRALTGEGAGYGLDPCAGLNLMPVDDDCIPPEIAKVSNLPPGTQICGEEEKAEATSEMSPPETDSEDECWTPEVPSQEPKPGGPDPAPPLAGPAERNGGAVPMPGELIQIDPCMIASGLKPPDGKGPDPSPQDDCGASGAATVDPGTPPAPPEPAPAPAPEPSPTPGEGTEGDDSENGGSDPEPNPQPEPAPAPEPSPDPPPTDGEGENASDGGGDKGGPSDPPSEGDPEPNPTQSGDGGSDEPNGAGTPTANPCGQLASEEASSSSGARFQPGPPNQLALPKVPPNTKKKAIKKPKKDLKGLCAGPVKSGWCKFIEGKNGTFYVKVDGKVPVFTYIPKSGDPGEYEEKKELHALGRFLYGDEATQKLLDDLFENDIDSDFIDNDVDPDIDGDGIDNAIDTDMDKDKIQNDQDPDIDGDGIDNEEDDTPYGCSESGPQKCLTSP